MDRPTEKELQQEENSIQEENNIQEDQGEPTLEEHQTETAQTPEQQKIESQEEEPLMELRMEPREEQLEMGRLELEEKIDDSDEKPNVQVEPISIDIEHLSLEESSRDQNDTNIAGSPCSPNGSGEILLKCEQATVTVGEDSKEELTSFVNEEINTVESVDDSEARESDGGEEKSGEIHISTTPPATAIKIVKVSIKQRSHKDTDNKIGEKAFESSV